ncbi:UPF0545 protein C22orf39 homolog [Cimex lectularius]|uniref:Synaptic plasticity regulator PANTS n=1 Tax=Cimex lectularius TaxID=79782 RepID=A0A8I6R7U9_CIMLE|nr:UPF0545 protein C22orf39 homolog [Cimex lectularius]
MEEELSDRYKKKLWMVRNCDVYNDEYKDCKSIKARFHQQFVYGSFVDCSQWKRDYNNCEKWNTKKNKKAVEELIESEVARRKERLDAHFNNDIWERRDNPPAEWNDPLPERFKNRVEKSYLALKSKEMKEGVTPERTFCVIS